MLYQLPDKQTILGLLIEGCTMPENDILDVLLVFARENHMQRRGAIGIIAQYYLAVELIASRLGSLPLLRGIMTAQFEDVMTKLFRENPEFLREVLEAHMEFQRYMGEK